MVLANLRSSPTKVAALCRVHQRSLPSMQRLLRPVLIKCKLKYWKRVKFSAAMTAAWRYSFRNPTMRNSWHQWHQVVCLSVSTSCRLRKCVRTSPVSSRTVKKNKHPTSVSFAWHSLSRTDSSLLYSRHYLVTRGGEGIKMFWFSQGGEKSWVGGLARKLRSITVHRGLKAN